MSCDVAVAAFLMFTSAAPAAVPDAQPAVTAAPPPSVAGEPLFKDIVSRASKLKAEVEDYRKGLAGASAVTILPGFDGFRDQIGQLAALDQQGHEVLVARGNKDDLKCILHGISQDLPLKLGAMTDAKTPHDEDVALRDMDYLLGDNVDVITAPPQPAA
jgi:hypothetical protein